MTITLSLDGYCLATDVAALLQSHITINTTSKPTTAQTEEFITRYFGEIGGMLVGAKYVHPIAQAGGSLSVSAGTITVKDAVEERNRALTWNGTGGSLSGIVRPGDFFTVAGDPQPYVITRDSSVDDSGEIPVSFSPGLELDVAGGAVVTYTAAVGAADTLKELNILGAAVRVLWAAFGPDADPAVLDPIKEERDRLFENIGNGNIVLLGADKIIPGAVTGTTEMVRV